MNELSDWHTSHGDAMHLPIAPRILGRRIYAKSQLTDQKYIPFETFFDTVYHGCLRVKKLFKFKMTFKDYYDEYCVSDYEEFDIGDEIDLYSRSEKVPMIYQDLKTMVYVNLVTRQPWNWDRFNAMLRTADEETGRITKEQYETFIDTVDPNVETVDIEGAAEMHKRGEW